MEYGIFILVLAGIGAFFMAFKFATGSPFRIRWLSSSLRFRLQVPKPNSHAFDDPRQAMRFQRSIQGLSCSKKRLGHMLATGLARTESDQCGLLTSEREKAPLSHTFSPARLP
jgi:hypothetical protein